MDKLKNSFIKTDDNTIINEQCIKWVRKIDECLEICAKSNGCSKLKYSDDSDKHRICKINNADSYNKLNKLFE